MKKVFIIALITVLFVAPSIVFAEGEYCADENLLEYGNRLQNFEYSYDIKYDNVDRVDKDGLWVNYITISIVDLPEGYSAILIDKYGESYNLKYEEAKVSGGINTVYFYYDDCMNDYIKEEQIYLPYYTKGAVKPFDDGSVVMQKKSTPSILITVGLTIIAIILFVLVILIIKKGRKK